MYNRYIPDGGRYTRVVEDDGPPQAPPEPPPGTPPPPRVRAEPAIFS